MGLEPGLAVTFGIRPETVGTKNSGPAGVAVFETETVQVERLGAETIIISRISGTDSKLIARIGGDVPVLVGERQALCADLAAVHVFDASGKALRPTLHSR